MGRMEIAEFLLARFAEDEAVAKAATPGPWRWDGDREKDQADLWGQPEGADKYANPVITASGMHTEGYIYVTEPDAEHIARHDPARVLRKCAADRRIVELVTGPIYRLVERVEDEWGGGDYATGEDEDLLRALALPYADHEDYNPEWKP